MMSETHKDMIQNEIANMSSYPSYKVTTTFAQVISHLLKKLVLLKILPNDVTSTPLKAHQFCFFKTLPYEKILSKV